MQKAEHADMTNQGQGNDEWAIQGGSFLFSACQKGVQAVFGERRQAFNPVQLRIASPVSGPSV